MNKWMIWGAHPLFLETPMFQTHTILYDLRRASGGFVDVRLTQLFTREFQVTGEYQPKRPGGTSGAAGGPVFS